MSTAMWDWDKYEQMSSLFFELVGSRVLRPLNERFPMEAIHGGLLL